MTVLNTQIAETINITENGQYDVARYTTANVSTPAAPAHYIEKTVDANGTLKNSSSFVNLNGVTEIGVCALAYQYRGVSFPANTSLDLSSLTSLTNQRALHYTFTSSNVANVDLSSVTLISGDNTCSYMFEYAGLKSINLNSLQKINGSGCCYSMFHLCTSLTSINFQSLTVIDGQNSVNNMFDNCTGMENINFNVLTYIGFMNNCQLMFQNCYSLTSVAFYSLKTLNTGTSQMFAGCRNLTSLYFPALRPNSTMNTGCFTNLLQRVTGCTIHFPKNLDPQSGSTKISSLTTYPNFGGTSTVLAFDLPSAVILTGANSQAYERSPKDDTATALAWRKRDTGAGDSPVIDWTPFYTNTQNDPSVGDTIYSDSACTTAVTTISSIA